MREEDDDDASFVVEDGYDDGMIDEVDEDAEAVSQNKNKQDADDDESVDTVESENGLGDEDTEYEDSSSHFV
jgi:hypothetical protein